MKRLLLILMVAFLLLPGMVSAQTNYWCCPDNNPATGGANVIPFGTGGTGSWDNQRCQFLVKQSFLPSKATIIKSVGFAPSGSGTYLYKAMVITIGHNTSGILGPTFAGSYSAPAMNVTVINQVNFSWAVTANTWNRIPLVGRPFIYNGKDNLVVDVCALGSSASPGKSGFRRMTEPRYYKTGMTPTAVTGIYGKGCPGSNTKTPAFGPYGFPLIGSIDMKIGVHDGASNASALLFLGNSKTTFSGLTLPFDLSVVGAKNCFLNAKIIMMLPATLDPQGGGYVTLTLPNLTSMEGASFFTQWAIMDTGANPGNLVTTAGLEFKLGNAGATSGSGPSAAALKVEIGTL